MSPERLLFQDSPQQEATDLEPRRNQLYEVFVLHLRSRVKFGMLVLPVSHPHCFEN